MKKGIVIVIMLLAGILLTRYEISLVESAKTVHQIEAIAVASDIEAGTVLSSAHLKRVSIDAELWSSGYFESIEDVIGQTLRSDLSKNALVMKTQLKESAFDTPSTGNAVTAIQLEPETALCWTLSKGEPVEVVCVDEENYQTLGSVVVVGLFDSALLESRTPEYVLIEGTVATVEAIVRSRENGRLEIVKYAGN